MHSGIVATNYAGQVEHRLLGVLGGPTALVSALMRSKCTGSWRDAHYRFPLPLAKASAHTRLKALFAACWLAGVPSQINMYLYRPDSLHFASRTTPLNAEQAQHHGRWGPLGRRCPLECVPHRNSVRFSQLAVCAKASRHCLMHIWYCTIVLRVRIPRGYTIKTELAADSLTLITHATSQLWFRFAGCSDLACCCTSCTYGKQGELLGYRFRDHCILGYCFSCREFACQLFTWLRCRHHEEHVSVLAVDVVAAALATTAGAAKIPCFCTPQSSTFATARYYG